MGKALNMRSKFQRGHIQRGHQIGLVVEYQVSSIKLAYDDFFKLSPSSVTRGHAYKLYKPDSTSAARSHFFACRVINAWNSLPPSTDFRNVNVFKHSLFTARLTKFLVGTHD